MDCQSIKHSKVRIGFEAFLGLTFLLCGCFIYLLFRSENTNIYKWCSSLGFTNHIKFIRDIVSNDSIIDFTRYNLPDGLYCVAYILLVDAIWHRDKVMKYWIVSIIPTIAIINEILQYFEVVNGTFDWYDLICYTTPLLLYFILSNHLIKKKIMKKFILTTAVIALFAMGFTASGDSEEVRYDDAGRKYHKVIPKCHDCGKENPYHAYWQDDKGNRMGEPAGNIIHGIYRCNDCIDKWSGYKK